ncbi:MAG TPA: hypothetical protein VIA62_14205 [Thermoanaerobaculia bacterium]|jgi:hypothetical protein|nr:hypothetical protein [Thermoanaerobaculia bacterium]
MEVITIINQTRDKVRVALFEQPASVDKAAIAAAVADVASHGRGRLIPAAGQNGASLYVAIVRSVQPGDTIPAWSVHEAVPIENGQTATITGSVSRGFEFKVK